MLFLICSSILLISIVCEVINLFLNPGFNFVNSFKYDNALYELGNNEILLLFKDISRGCPLLLARNHAVERL